MNDNIKNTDELNTQAVLSMRDSGYYSEKTAGAKIANDPNGHSMDYIHIIMEIEKI